MTREEKHQRMVERLGSEEAVKEYYRAIQKKSRETYIKNGAKGGFRGISPERLSEISRLGGKASKRGKKTDETAA